MPDSSPHSEPRRRTLVSSSLTCLLAAVLSIGPMAGLLPPWTALTPEIPVSTPVRDASTYAPDSLTASAQESIAKREYEATRNDRGLQAPNRAHNLRTYFEPWGIRVEDRTAEGSPELFRMRTVGIGRADRVIPVADGVVRAQGARVENRRDDGTVEWYENGEAGFEHGYVLDRRPSGEGELRIELAFEGASVMVNEGRAMIVTATGRELEYSKLVVLDTTGYELPSRLERAEEGAIRLLIDDTRGEYPLVVDPLLTSNPDAILQSNQEGAYLGASVAGAGDLNGDGFADVIVGAFRYDSGQLDEGAAFIFHGGPAGIASGNPAAANATLEANQAGAEMGSSVAGAGDVNGDGYADVVVGAKYYDARGSAFVFHGGPSGVSSGNPTTANERLDLNQARAEVGSSVASAGDVNGDGYADVIVGATAYDSVPIDEGAAFVFHGGPAGVSNEPDTVLESNRASTKMGMSVASAGDVNGDGYADVIVGAALYYTPGEASDGAAFVFHGGPTGVASGGPEAANAILVSNQNGGQLGTSVSGAGDVNGDGYADVIVGANGYDAGQVEEGAAFVFHGGPTGVASGNPASANATLESNQAGAQMGSSVAGAGDVNGDGYADVIVGAPLFDADRLNDGAAFVFHGGPAGVANGSSATATAMLDDGDFAGHSVDGAGDVNGDGYADVIVGASGYSSGAGLAGVYHGGATGIAPGNPATANAAIQSDHVGGQLGYSVASAGDVNGDGYADVIVGALGYDVGEPNEGAAFVFHGGPTGIASGNPGTANATLQSNQASANMGDSVAGIGDVNGDGYGDVIVGVAFYDAGETDEGAAFVFHGGPSGITSGNPSTADATLQSNQAHAYLGYSSAGAGDVNGDGYADVIVGSFSYDADLTNEGIAVVFHGGPSGITSGSPATASAVLQSGQTGARLGYSVAGAGDVNGDGYADVIVGAYMFRDDLLNFEGLALVFHGSPTGIASGNPGTANTALQSSQPSGHLGVSVAGAGDVNADGFADVIVGADGIDAGQAEEGAAFVFHGSPAGVSSGNSATANATLQSDQADAGMGYTVAGAGDVNGDGYADVIVGAYKYDAGQSNEGAAFVFHGGPTGVANGNPASANATLQSDQSNAFFSWGVAGAGDINGDGYADVIVGAQFYDAGEDNEGTAFVFHGNGDGIGRSVSARQLRGDGDNTNVEPWGSSISIDSFQVRMTATHPLGRGRVKLEIQATPAGENWGGPSNITVRSASWVDVTATSAGVTITETVSGLAPSTLYRWRARVLHAPFTLINEPLQPSHGPWRRMRGQAVEADIRTVTPCSLTCPLDVTVPNEAGQCGATVTYSLPTTSGPCGLITCTPATGSLFPVGTTTVNCSTDSGPSCSFTVTVNDTEAPVATCPAPISVGSDTGQCSAVVNFSASASDNCPGATVACVPASGSTFAIGVTTVTCTATDASSNTGSCSFDVTVSDDESPTVACPSPTSVPNAPGQCSAVVNFATPAASDNCPGATVTCVPSSGSSFPIGVTTVTCTATDSASNTGSCSFTVTVNDTQAPTAVCPAPITVANAPGTCSSVVTYSASAMDNCPGATVACAPASGSTFPVGVTTVTCTATDASSNTAACSFTVTVNDTQAPGLSCPANVQTTALTAAGRVVNFTVPTATDNCGATVACLPASGSTFAIGTTMVTCTATDAANNATNCQFSVTVAPLGTDTAGIYVPTSGSWFLRNANSSGSADLVFGYGPANLGWIALRGDWDGNGSDTAGLYDPANGNFFLKNTNAAGGADLVYGFGPAGFGWQPLVGDWDGDGVDTIGLYDPSSGFFFLRNTHAPGAADLVYGFGPAGTGWTPMLGDWDGNGTDTVGLYDPSTGNFFLRNAHAAGGADLVYGFGPAGIGWKPLAGDWNGDGADTIGLYSPTNGFFFLRNFHAPGAADVVFGYGPANTTPILGDWNGL